MKNSLGRELPDAEMKELKYQPYQSTEIGNPVISWVAPKVRVSTGDDKVIFSVDEVIKDVLQDGMTISFHHHFREGDFVFNLVMDRIIKLGYKDLTLAPSSLTNVMNDKVIEAIKAGTVTNITTSGMRGELGEQVSHGLLKNSVIFRSHGNRARSIENGNIKIDVAFLGVPNADRLGNANGMEVESAFGSMGYALIDAKYANKVVLLTDTIVDYPNTPASIEQTQVDYVVKVDRVGDPDRIGSGATRFTKDPKELKIARMVNDVITHSPYFKQDFSFQTGTGGVALAVTKFLGESMKKAGITAAFTCGETTSPIVDLLEAGLIKKVMDVQDFDKGAASSMKSNPDQAEIDTDFNVNVLTGSNGEIRGAVGGHQDAGTAKMTIISAPLTRGRIATVVHSVNSVSTPGASIDVLVTEVGIAINPARQDLIDAFSKVPSLPIVSIEELQKRAEATVGKPAPVEYTDRVVGLVEYRDGSLIDAIKQVKD